MRNGLLLLVLCATLTAHGQFSRLEVSSTTRTPFFIAINDSLTAEQAFSYHVIDSIPAGEHSFWFIIDSTFQKLQMLLSLPPGKTSVFLLQTNDSLLMLTPEPPAKPSARPKPRPEVIAGPLRKGVTLDSLSHWEKIQQYRGEKGCLYLLPEKEFQKDIGKLSGLLLERDRFDAVTTLISGSCLMVSQLSDLLNLFEFDDTRLKLLELSKGHLFDLDQRNDLLEDFELNSTRQKARSLLEKLQQ